MNFVCNEGNVVQLSVPYIALCDFQNKIEKLLRQPSISSFQEKEEMKCFSFNFLLVNYFHLH